MRVNSFFGGPIEVSNEAQKAQVTKLLKRTNLSAQIAWSALAASLLVGGATLAFCLVTGVFKSEAAAYVAIGGYSVLCGFGSAAIYFGPPESLSDFVRSREEACADAIEKYEAEKAGTSGTPFDDKVIRPDNTPEGSETE